MKTNFGIRSDFSMKPNLRIRFDFSMKHNFSIRFDFGIKPNFSIRFDFGIKHVLERDSQFNSTLGREMKRSLAKFIISTQCCT